MDYATEARAQRYKNILKYGVAFKNKVCYAVFEKELIGVCELCE